MDAGPRESKPRPFVLTTFFDGGPEEGGGYTQKHRILDVLRRLQDSHIKVVVICSSQAGLRSVQARGLHAVLETRSIVRKVIARFCNTLFARRLFGRQLTRLPFLLDAQLRHHQTDLVLFMGPDGRALELAAHNFIFSVWDLCHLEHPEFPEVAHFGEFERREYLYGNVLPRATAVIADSEYGRQLIKERYRISSDRTFTAPFLTYDHYRNFVAKEDELQRIRQKYGLTPPYIYYPAQFWPHKNHKYILEAASLMKNRSSWVPQIVFSGADKGGLDGLLKYACELGIHDKVVNCGFVPDQEVPYLYAGALALVMPTYFGPTNIPPKEALALGVPVCYSDFQSFREQMGESVFYIGLDDPGSLADVLESIRQGQRKGSATSAAEGHDDGAEDNYLAVLKRIIGAYRVKVSGALRVG